MSLRALLARITAALGLVGLVILVGFQIIPLLAGPKVLTLEPGHGATVATPLLTIAGATERTRFVSINEISVTLFEDGSFEHTTALAPGINTFDIVFEDKHGRTQHIVREIFRTISTQE